MYKNHSLAAAAVAAITSLLPLALHAQQATCLTTDMLCHTGRVWLGGYPSTASLASMPAGDGRWQAAVVASSRPVLGWVMESERPQTLQTAFHAVVSSTAARAAAGDGDVWDSRRTQGRCQSVTVGTALKPSTVYYWSVRLWDNHGGEGRFAPPVAFRTADTLDTGVSHYPIELTDERPLTVSQAAPPCSGVRPLAADGAAPASALLFDFGLDAFAQLSLSVTSPAVADTLVVHLGEQCLNGRVNRRPEGAQRYSRYVVPLMQGTHTYRIALRPDPRNTSPSLNESGVAPILMPRYIGEVTPMRYCEVESVSGAGGSAGGPVRVDGVTRHVAHYPFNDRQATFVSSDSVLNAVWQLCKHSMKALSFAGIYVDGDRERIPYEADAIINQLSHYAVDREYSIARRSIRHLIYNPTWPTEWIMQSVIMAWNDYMYTGDKRLLAATYADLKAKTLQALRGADGLISTRDGRLTRDVERSVHFRGRGLRDIVDWPQTGAQGIEKEAGGEADGFVFCKYNTVVNAYHYEAMRLMAKVAGVLGHGADSLQFERGAAATRHAVNTRLADPLTRLYHDGDSTAHTSLHANMFALCFGIPREADRQKVAAFVKSRGMACSVYGAQFLLDALYDAGEAGAALGLLTSTGKRSWWNMLRAGSTITTEAWDNVYKPNQDWNHAWGAAAANIIVRKLMGVEPLEPGFARIRIKPQLAGLARASLLTPTIRGDVGLTVTDSIVVSIPANTTAEVWLQAAGRRAEVDGRRVKGRRHGQWLIVEVGSGRHVVKQ